MGLWHTSSLSDVNLSLEQEWVAVKENEILAILKLPDDINIRQGNVVSIDALVKLGVYNLNI